MDRRGYGPVFWRTTLVTVLFALVAGGGGASAGAQAGDQFSEAVATGLVDQVRRGLETNNQDEVLSAFDPEKMQDYAAFRDQVRGLMENYDSFRVSYNVRQVWTDAPTNAALVEFELEAFSRDDNSPPRRSSAQLRFEFAKSAKGWKIVALAPREFFS